MLKMVLYYSVSGTHCFGEGDLLFLSWDPLGWLSVRPRTHLLKFVNETLLVSSTGMVPYYLSYLLFQPVSTSASRS